MIFDCLEEQWQTEELKIFDMTEDELEADGAGGKMQKYNLFVTLRDVVDAGGVVLLLFGACLLFKTVLMWHKQR